VTETAAQRRRRRTRAEVTRRAVELFAARGYAATSTEQVAAAADLSRSTLFRLFADKEDLLFGLEDDLLATAAAAVAEAPPDLPPWAALRAAAVRIAEQVGPLRDLLVTRSRWSRRSRRWVPARPPNTGGGRRRWRPA
jgi:AcrR family transcriptional regulator